MSENRKKDIAKEYIKENILNKDLVEIQESLQELKDSIKPDDNGNNKDKKIFGLDKIMNIIFNDEGDVRSRFGFNINKLTSIMYMMISEEGRENLELLYNELEKAKSESELKKNLGIDLWNLQSEIISNNQSGQNTSKKTQSNYDIQNNNNYYSRNKYTEDNSRLNDNSKLNDNYESLNKKENYIVNQAKLYGISDVRQIAYILATVKLECNFKNIEERGKGRGRDYGKIDQTTGQTYYGRGFVQLTWKGNYESFTKIIKESGLNFKDNRGNILKGKDINLVKNPDLILQSDDLAAFILIYGMKNGTFTGKKLDDYINSQQCDFEKARTIVNGMDHASKFAGYAKKYLKKLGGKNNGNKKIEKKNNGKNNILNGPELLANNRDQLGGLGSSILVGIQGANKSQFKNMDGIDSATTRNQDWFWKKGKKGELDKEKIKNYCNSKGIKSFLFYFGGNESVSGVDAVNNAYDDIKSMGKYLDSIGVQPVLCTCMGEKIKEHSVGGNGKIYPLADGTNGKLGFNNKIRNLGKNMNWPVMDFAKIDDNIPKGDDKIHPTGSGYEIMRKEIDKCLF